MLDTEATRRISEVHGAIRCDRRIVAEPHRRAVHFVDKYLGTAIVDVDGEQPAVRIAYQQPAVGQPLQTEWTAAGVGNRAQHTTVHPDPEDPAVGDPGDDPAIAVEQHVLRPDAAHR